MKFVPSCSVRLALSPERKAPAAGPGRSLKGTSSRKAMLLGAAARVNMGSYWNRETPHMSPLGKDKTIQKPHWANRSPHNQ